MTVTPNGEKGAGVVGGLVRPVTPRMHPTRGSLRQGNTTSCI